jgi:hypothetical protein
MRSLLVAVTLLISLISVGTAHADRRAFAATYEYQTMPKGGLDLEIWNIQSHPDISSSAQSFTWKLETEYGITDHWDIALYQVFSQGSATPLTYDSTSLETRYRFAERGEWPVDVLAYFEVDKFFDANDWELEWKVILARDIGRLTLALNLIAEDSIVDGDHFFVPGFAAGASFEIVPALKVGAEIFGERSEDHNVRAWAGPAISWAPSPKLWVTVGADFGLTSYSDDLRATIILGISL